MNITVPINIQKFVRKVKFVFISYKVTFIIIMSFTIWEAGRAAIPYEYYWDFHFWVHMIRRTLLYLIIPSLFIETYFVENKMKSVCGYSIALIFSGAVAACGNLYIFSRVDLNRELSVDIQQIVEFLPANIQRIAGPGGMLIKDYAEKFLCGTLLILSAAIVYKCFKETKLRFEEYVIKVFHNITKSMIIWFVLRLCSAFVDSVMANSFLRKYYFEYDMQVAGEILVLDLFWMGPVEVLVTGFYLAPKIILALKDMDKEPGKILCAVVRDILPIMILCAMGVVYLYILVMLFMSQISFNVSIVFRLFCFGLPVWIMTGYYMDKSKYMMFISILPYLFIPLICFQGYFAGIQIYQYGMTPERYVEMMLIIFEAGTLFIWHFRKGQYEKLLPFFGILVVIAVFVPGINMNRASNLWQMSSLEKYYRTVFDGGMISDLGYKRLKGAYEYLRNRPEMQAAIEPYDIYEKSFVTKLKEQYGEADLTQYNKCWLSCRMAEALDASAYAPKNKLNQNSCYDKEGENGIDVDFSCFQFVDNETGEIITVDISGFVEQCMADLEAFPDVLGEECTATRVYNCIELDDDTVLYINGFNAEYFDGVKNAEPYLKWKYIDINGILLQNMRDRKPAMYILQKSEILWSRG